MAFQPAAGCPSGMSTPAATRGGLTEEEQGQALIECYEDIMDAGSAGSCVPSAGQTVQAFLEHDVRGRFVIPPTGAITRLTASPLAF